MTETIVGVVLSVVIFVLCSQRACAHNWQMGLRRHNKRSGGCRYFAMRFDTVAESCGICEGHESHEVPEPATNQTTEQLIARLLSEGASQPYPR
jgi:hypothetical protein